MWKNSQDDIERKAMVEAFPNKVLKMIVIK